MKKVFCYFLPVVLVLLFMCFCNFEKTYSNDETVIEEEFLAHTPEFEVSGQAVSGDVAAALETNEWPETFLEKYQIKNIEAIKTEEGSYFVKVEYRTRVLKKETEEYDVTVTCDADAGVPEDAELSVNEISKEEEGYEKYLKETYQMLQANEYASSAKMLDISILAEDGTEIEPEKEVNVEIVYHDSLSVQEDEGIKIIHLTDAPEVIEPEVKINENGDVEQLSFQTDSFSVYSILSSGKTEDLDGEAYAAVLLKSGKSSGAALSQTAMDSSKLSSTVVTVNNGKIFCSGTVSVWHFEAADDGGYYIYAMDGDEKQYLTITSSKVTTSTTKSSIIVQKGTGSYAGMVRFYSSSAGKALNLWGGSDTGGFGPWNGTNDPNEWFTLYNVDEIEATPLTPVNTIDHNAAGVKMRLIDYSSTEQATYGIGGDYTGPVHQGLLNSILGSDGYPVTTGGTSLNGLFSGGTEVNNLFIKQTYEETGFYEYSSFKNYAYLEDDGNFTVYEELGTPSNENFPWYRRGNFMPYNKISPGGYSLN
ncbi:MAG: hypothetical protein J6K26_06350, partial [Lachnospiraceae bacterium]|nr:hypothetical protein [Lachnospiraceae bacterium]